MQCDSCLKVLSSRSSVTRHKRESCPQRFNNKVKKVKLSGVDTSANINYSATAEATSRPTAEASNTRSVKTRSNIIECQDCYKKICGRGLTGHLRSNSHKSVINYLDSGVEKLSSSFKNRISSYRLTSSKHHTDHLEFFNEIEGNVLSLLHNYLHEFKVIKVNVELYSMYTIPEKDTYDLKSFNTQNQIITISTNLKQAYQDFISEILPKVSEIQEKDSGWSLLQIQSLEVNINKYNPLRSSSYIRLPRQIEVKKAVINIMNKDEACFGWAVNASIFNPTGKSNLTTSYPHYTSLLQFHNIEFPMKLSDIPKFELLNNISINVFGVSECFKNNVTQLEIVGPLYHTKSKKSTHVNLLLIFDDNGNSHYCYIKNLSRLISSQKSHHNGQTFLCNGCLQFFSSLERLHKHEDNDCNFVYTKLPTTDMILNKFGRLQKENILQFSNFHKQMQVPFVIYADFESILQPIQHATSSDNSSFTVKTYQHTPYSFGFYIKCYFDDSLSQLIIYRGDNVAETFIQKLEKEVYTIYHKYLKHIKPMKKLTTAEELQFFESKCCHICDKPFDINEMKVRDHSHLTGLFSGAAHNACNLNYKLPKFIPVFMHNLTNYDAHLFITKLAQNNEKIDVIAQTKEKYISFTKLLLVDRGLEQNTYLKLRFVDSFRFLPHSLDNLSKTLNGEQCLELRKYCRSNEEFGLLRQKGVFPYSYLDNFSKLSEVSLPAQEQFFDVLKGEGISDEKYLRAKQVWEVFDCKNLGEYSDVYLKSDVLLLADVFENFRRNCLFNYKLDPAQYLTAPSLSWDAMLRKTNIQLELLTDIDMLHFFKKGIRGGISQCSTRFATANNQYCENYDCSKPTSYILYLDATNLYGYAMSQYLPHGDFRWLDGVEITNFDCLSIDDESPKGYVLEVDLTYPETLHDHHNDLPFCPENIIPPNGKDPKLVLTLLPKHKYIIHYRNLKQCVEQRLKVAKIYRILEFSQSPWLKPYIELNTNLRNSSDNEFDKSTYKNYTNSIYGKTMENVDKRVDIKLLSHWENLPGSIGAEGFISMPNFHSVSIFSDNLVAIQMNILKIVYDKPVYVGFSILEISKIRMYDFFYNYIKAKYMGDATLLYTDTDSLILHIQTENVYRDIKENLDLFDTSNYPVDNIFNIPKTPSVVGKLKDEFKGQPITNFCGTGAKAYCVTLSNNKHFKKAKGISKNVINKSLTFTDYKQVVDNVNAKIYRKMYTFKSHLHEMYTELKNKVALTSHDDKRYVIPGAINTLAWGHYKIDAFIPDQQQNNLDYLIQQAKLLLPEQENNDGREFYVDSFEMDLL
ncbi:uncharacterized protein LOC126883817 [Diabrotica virgifera virgifera]|uniref:DNA-directed DNA polymerase n=1 Tax=Diabrotica virgifera virgifera TaxID=50390 RepID=A0ABM5K5I9_DIAVI|nr:uncharacterized protein LOC126883817 [Diabrotica virgifera virgifera]